MLNDQFEAVAEVLKRETMERNRDMPRDKPWPEARQLILYKIRKPN